MTTKLAEWPSGHRKTEKSGDRLAAEKTLFPRRWYGGMISANLEGIWEMSVYMSFRHGVEISDDERTMFEQWYANDPVSPWESAREKRIAKRTFVINPLVHDVATDAAGACPWE